MRGLFLLLVGLFALRSAQEAPHEERTLHVLFLGNSYTEVNDLPALVKALGQSAKPAWKIEVARSTPGGCTLQRHAADSATLARIADEHWDAVVLQEQSLRPIEDPESMFVAARSLHAVIRAAHARTLFFMTWAREAHPATIDGLAQSYRTIALELGAELAPAGLAWKDALERDPELGLYRPDGSHPAPAGSYLAALVVFGRLTGAKVEGLGGAGTELDKSTVRKLQAVAARRLELERKREQRPAEPASGTER